MQDLQGAARAALALASAPAIMRAERTERVRNLWNARKLARACRLVNNKHTLARLARNKRCL